MKKIFLQEFKKIIVNDYLLIKSIKKVSIKNNITTRQVLNILNEFNIKHIKQRKTLLDEKYFDNYNEENLGKEVMYWAGFIAADGNVRNDSVKRNYSMNINLGIKDINHIKKIHSCLKSTAKIRINEQKGGFRAGKNFKNSTVCSVSFSSKYLVESLKIFNIVPAKTKIYDIPKEFYEHKYINHFIRGFMDGDGSISFKEKYIRVSFYGNKECLESISEIIFNKCYIKKRSISINRTIYATEYAGKDAISLIKWLYNDATMYLDRKYEIVKNII